MPALPAVPAAKVVLLAGPSGCGKSRLAERSGLSVLALDDFYRSGDDPDLPRLPHGEVDWDHPGSWNAAAAQAALESLCRTGSAEVPVYDLAANGPSGSRTVSLRDERVFVAEGIFVAELVAGCADHDLLERAICVRRSRWITFALRLSRDLRERRKSPAFLVRRGLLLARREPAIVRALLAAGCRPMSVRATRRYLAGLKQR
ncbi:uridine kinase family protein [Nakamurella lactea]|uniref:uridine kinase family protein n=1 Tax=Nakamurella lactea TaxID=459515 RepID=UPI001B7FCF0D|nr:hypothetical protein [Nakamurella lactea]